MILLINSYLKIIRFFYCQTLYITIRFFFTAKHYIQQIFYLMFIARTRWTKIQYILYIDIKQVAKSLIRLIWHWICFLGDFDMASKAPRPNNPNPPVRWTVITDESWAYEFLCPGLVQVFLNTSMVYKRVDITQPT